MSILCITLYSKISIFSQKNEFWRVEDWHRFTTIYKFWMNKITKFIPTFSTSSKNDHVFDGDDRKVNTPLGTLETSVYGGHLQVGNKSHLWTVDTHKRNFQDWNRRRWCHKAKRPRHFWFIERSEQSNESLCDLLRRPLLDGHNWASVQKGQTRTHCGVVSLNIATEGFFSSFQHGTKRAGPGINYH